MAYTPPRALLKNVKLRTWSKRPSQQLHTYLQHKECMLRWSRGLNNQADTENMCRRQRQHSSQRYTA